jgi:hypothetical protein
MRDGHRANRHEIPIFTFSVATKDDCHRDSFITGGHCCREFLYGSPVIWLSLVVQMANPCDMGSVSIGFSPFYRGFLGLRCMQHAIRCCLDHIIFNRFAFLAPLGSWFNESVLPRALSSTNVGTTLKLPICSISISRYIVGERKGNLGRSNHLCMGNDFLHCLLCACSFLVTIES